MSDVILVFIAHLLSTSLTSNISAASTGEAAQRIGGYLDALGTSPARAGGAGIASYTGNLGTNSAISGSSASAVKGYLDAMSAGAAASPSAPVVKELLDSVSSGESTGSGIANCKTI